MNKIKELIKVKKLLLFLVMGLLVINYFIPFQDQRFSFSFMDRDVIIEGTSNNSTSNGSTTSGSSEKNRTYNNIDNIDNLDIFRTINSEKSRDNLEENIRKAASNDGSMNNRVSRVKTEEEIREIKVQEIAEKTPMEEEWADILVRKSLEYDLDIYLLLGLIRVESVFDPTNVSSAGALGLMQLMPTTARYMAASQGVEFSEDRLFEPDYNIQLGTKYLNKLIEEYDGDLHKALTAYNRGEGGLQTFMRRSGTAESGFSRIVLEKADKYENKIDISHSF
ncbi:lytic transglycosylase domain-containing protein [Natranaerofaba carboxydovora]|uniref:lytic transglycosylase domain-containing protein n=1 Tax=Natranaerofaba carboxydovora TaxID=2742683 RepID=UPI001F134ACC|nr:transglycosylase SLT domain-containing protein [Natranaerofaba carboxydovora]UMZ75017.1 Membrane-bound lytic murein transglycosylase C [Natranaerofaba carboxydovora]